MKIEELGQNYCLSYKTKNILINACNNVQQQLLQRKINTKTIFLPFLLPQFLFGLPTLICQYYLQHINITIYGPDGIEKFILGLSSVITQEILNSLTIIQFQVNQQIQLGEIQFTLIQQDKLQCIVKEQQAIDHEKIKTTLPFSLERSRLFKGNDTTIEGVQYLAKDYQITVPEQKLEILLSNNIMLIFQ